MVLQNNGLCSLRFCAIALMWCLAQPFTHAYAGELSSDEVNYLKEKDTIVFVSQTKYPPFEFIGPDRDHTGMCIDLARWIATEFGFKVQFTDTSFKQAQAAVLSGKADILTSLFFSVKRDEVFDFTGVIFDVPASIFVLSERPDIKELEDLQGKTIAMQAGDYAQEFLEAKHLLGSLIFTPDFAAATDLVIAGKADAVIGDEQIVLYHIFSNHLTNRIKKVGAPLYIGQNCMGAKDPNPILIGILNKGIKLAQQKGVLEKINKKWIGTRYASESSWMVRHVPAVLVLVGCGLFATVLVWFWNIRLRKVVAKRTRELANSEGTLRAILSSSPIGIGILQNNVIDWHNEAMSRILGYVPEELCGKSPQILYADDAEREKTGFEISEQLRRKDSVLVEARWCRKDGSGFDCLLRYAPVERKNDKAMAVVLVEDVTERKLFQKRLQESQAHLKTLLNTIPDLVWLKDPKGIYLSCNPRFEEFFGAAEGNIVGKTDYDFVAKELADFFVQHDQKAMASGKPCVNEEEITFASDGHQEYLETIKTPMYGTDGLLIGVLGIARDISDRRSAAEMLQIALQEKEVLLREIYHRVKNNMQVISSLLTLQIERMDNEQARQELLESRQRIIAMSMIHEELYKGKNLEAIDLSAYLKSLIGYLQGIYSSRAEISIDLRVDNVDIGMDQAVPCGLIINELVTNAFKHAFPGRKQGEIQIKVRLVNQTEVVVEVRDNGVGIGTAVDLENPSTLGLRLVQGLLKHQLSGTLKIVIEAGTAITLQWRLTAGKGDAA
jgi:PAS domain S-box-containing protein